MIDYPYPKAVERFPELRQSLLSTFDRCALSASFEIEYRRGWSTAPQARGQMFHRVASECLRTMASLNETTIPVDAALSILHDVLRQADVDRVCRKCGAAVRPGVVDGMRTCVKGHRFETDLVNVPMAMVKDLHWCVIKWANDNAFDIADLVEVEQRMKAELRYPNHLTGGSVPRVLTGAIDALFISGVEEATVIDWKDMWAMPPPAEVSFGGYFQQRFYAWLIFRNFPTVQRVTLREFYIRYSAVREATVWRTDEEAIGDELAALAERFDRAYEEKAWPATPGKPQCGFCLRPTLCPIPAFARGDGRIIDEERAMEMARQLVKAEAIQANVRGALNAWSAIHGPVPFNSVKGKRAFAHIETVRTKRPELEEIREAESQKGSPLTSDEIAKLYKKSIGTRFGEVTPEEYDEAAAEAELTEKLKASITAADERRAEQEVAEAAKVVDLDSVRRAS